MKFLPYYILCISNFPYFIPCIYFQTSTSIAANTTLVLLELILEIIYLGYFLGRLAYVELFSKCESFYSFNSSYCSLRLLDNDNCYNLYRDKTSNVYVSEEIFTLLTINNLNVVETGGVIDFSLILGNHVDTYLYGLLSVTNLWQRGSLTKLVLF